MAQTLPGESASKLWRGLTDSEAQRRLRRFGPNTLPAAHKATLFSIAFATLKEPMLVLLLSTGVVYLLIGDLREAIACLDEYRISLANIGGMLRVRPETSGRIAEFSEHEAD